MGDLCRLYCEALEWDTCLPEAQRSSNKFFFGLHPLTSLGQSMYCRFHGILTKSAQLAHPKNRFSPNDIYWAKHEFHYLQKCYLVSPPSPLFIFCFT